MITEGEFILSGIKGLRNQIFLELLTSKRSSYYKNIL